MVKKYSNRLQHVKANYWIAKGIFDGVNTFSDLFTRISELHIEKDRGDVFEIFIEGYLQTQIINQCTQHWVTGNIPASLRNCFNLPSHDAGIDGVYPVSQKTPSFRSGM